ncbi:hypothetical protein [Ideonella sp.]|uniref:hypothetical protein n=1 Tax=Ideonella sp. TaxID=1929293 RepID=UPI00351BD4C6
MVRARRRLYVFSPLPPQRNGLADYLVEYLGLLAQDFEVLAVTQARHLLDSQQALTSLPITLISESQFLARQPDPAAQTLFNLGNNGDCVYMLDHLRAFPGAVIVHDVSLFYLHQLALQRAWANSLFGHWLAEEGHAIPGEFLHRDGALHSTPGMLYQECLMLRRVVGAGQGVMVHTRYAERRLRGAVHGLPLGAEQGRPLLRMPHFVLPPPALAVDRRAEVLAKFSVSPDAFLMLVPGFLTGNKMLYEVLAAFRQVQAQCPGSQLLLAGEERADEYPVSQRIAGWWPEGDRPEVSGYLEADELDVLLGRADLSFVLRYPTYGESSGILPRAALGGGQVLTVDIGAYPEFQSPQVRTVPVGSPCVPALVEGILRAYRMWQQDSPAARASRQADEALRQQALTPALLYPGLRDWLHESWRLTQPGEAVRSPTVGVAS